VTGGEKSPAQFKPSPEPARMELVTVASAATALLKIPPPSPVGPVLPEKVQLVTVRVPSSLRMPPPLVDALLPEKVLLVTFRVLNK